MLSSLYNQAVLLKWFRRSLTYVTCVLCVKNTYYGERVLPVSRLSREKFFRRAGGDSKVWETMLLGDVHRRAIRINVTVMVVARSWDLLFSDLDKAAGRIVAI